MKMTKPKMKVNDIFDACIRNMQENNKSIYSACLSEIVSSTEQYEQNMKNGNHEKMVQSDSIADIPKSKLEKLYTDKLVKSNQPARQYYDEIISTAPLGICPYCHQQIVSTLDHYYPKAHYISLVISPTNLIPSCANCNKNKMDIIIQKKEDAILNPYYEDPDSFIWLSAELNEDISSNILTMRFYVSPPDNCDPVLKKRLENQFDLLKLNNLYSKHAAEEMIGVRNRHLRIYKVAGASGVKENILESIEENTYRPNAWQSAMYRGVNNDWYLNKWLPLYSEK